MKRFFKYGYVHPGQIAGLLLGLAALAFLYLPSLTDIAQAACNAPEGKIIDVKIKPDRVCETQIAVEYSLKYALGVTVLPSEIMWSISPLDMNLLGKERYPRTRVITSPLTYEVLDGGTLMEKDSDIARYMIKASIDDGSGDCSDSVLALSTYSTSDPQGSQELIEGDPVNLGNGATLRTSTDIYVPCPILPLSFVRTYSSRHDVYIRSGNMSNTNRLVAPLGAGWTHNYDWYVERRVYCIYKGEFAPEWLLVHGGDGNIYWIKGDVGAVDPRYEMKLQGRTYNGLECQIGASGGIAYNFDSNGVLTHISAPDSVAQYLTYEGTYPNQRLITVATTGRVLRLSYDDQSVAWAKPNGTSGRRNVQMINKVVFEGLLGGTPDRLSVDYSYTYANDNDLQPDELPLLHTVTRTTKYQVQTNTYEYTGGDRGVLALSVVTNPENHTFNYDYERHVMPADYTANPTAWPRLQRASAVAVNPGGYYDMMVDYNNGRSGKVIAKHLRPDRSAPASWEETWELNEGMGNSITGKLYGASGTIYGAVWTNGVKGRALFFNGLSNYGTLSSAITGPLQSLDISAFVRPEPGAAGLIAGDPSGLALGRTVTDYWFGFGPGQRASIPIPPASDTNWIQLLGVHVDTQLKLYLNGTLVATSAAGSYPTPPLSLAIGGASGYGYFHGSIDEVFVSGRDVSDPATLFSLANGNTPDYLTYVYQMDVARHYMDFRIGPYPSRQLIYAHDDGFNLISESLINTNTGLSLLSERTYDTEHHPLTQSLTYSGGLTSAPASVSLEWNSAFDIPSKITDALGRSVSMGIAASHVVSVSDAAGTTSFDYMDKVLSRMVNANGHFLNITNNPYGYAIGIYPQLGPSIAMERDPFGNVTKVTTPGTTRLRETTFDVDELGRVWRVDHPDGTYEQFVYDKIGDLTHYTDALTRRTDIAYAPTCVATQYVKDALGLAATTTVFFTEQFDALRITDPLGRPVESYLLDPERRPIVVTNLERQTMTIAYEHENLVDSINRFDGTTVSFDYDRAARLAREEYPGGQITEHHYYDNGLPSSVSNAAGVVSFGFDEANRLTSANGALPGVVDNIGYSYLPAGNIASVSSLLGTTTYDFDQAERLTLLRAPGMRDFTFNYHPSNGLPLSVTCTNTGISVVYGFDDMDRVTNIVWRNAATNVLRSFAYSYNAVGMITGVKREDETTRAYGFDGLDRLVSEQHYDSTTTLTKSVVIAYDLAGNRTQTSSGTVINTYTLGIGNRLATVGTNGSYLYNNAGCLTNIAYPGRNIGLLWDSRYQLEAIATNGTPCERNGYDALGRRLWKWDGQTTNYMVYNGIHLLAEVDGTGGIRRAYTQGPGIDNWLTMTVYTGATARTYNYLTDHQGTVHAIADETGIIVESYLYDAWGRVLGVYDGIGVPLNESAIGNRILWQGREYSWATGLYYFRARWYDPVTGRWLSNDPIGISGGLNQYVFCANNSVNFVDPTGLKLTDQQIANIVFNETRSLSGPDLHQARINLAHVIITDDWIEDNLGIKRPVTASSTVDKIPVDEKASYADAECAAKTARNQRNTKGFDPTGGATNFNLRPTKSTAPFYGCPLRTQSGPFNNSYPQGGLPASGVYVNTYGNANSVIKSRHY